MSSKPKRVVIGIDPHKRINAVAVVNEAGELIARETFANSSDGCRALQRFARRWRNRTWAVEGAGGVGKHLAQRLVATGEHVLDVPTKKSSLVRAFLSDSGRKTDDIDALTVALVGPAHSGPAWAVRGLPRRRRSGDRERRRSRRPGDRRCCGTLRRCVQAFCRTLSLLSRPAPVDTSAARSRRRPHRHR